MLEDGGPATRAAPRGQVAHVGPPGARRAVAQRPRAEFHGVSLHRPRHDRRWPIYGLCGAGYSRAKAGLRPRPGTVRTIRSGLGLVPDDAVLARALEGPRRRPPGDVRGGGAAARAPRQVYPAARRGGLHHGGAHHPAHGVRVSAHGVRGPRGPVPARRQDPGSSHPGEGEEQPRCYHTPRVVAGPGRREGRGHRGGPRFPPRGWGGGGRRAPQQPHVVREGGVRAAAVGRVRV
mmetsp:Transcript_2008/g.7143  ORF Transcript_2008/g.7143 Transcript_2008/m.7143 type:complete len:234 (-) Transcript_2008:36-737(-)